MERKTVGKPYWKAIENFPRHKEVIDRLSRKYDAVLARYPYKSGKYQLEEEDFFAELILQCREAEFCSGGSFWSGTAARLTQISMSGCCRRVSYITHTAICIWINAMARARLRSAHGWTFSKYEEEQSGSPIWGLPFVIA